MPSVVIENPILNSPFEEPQRHFRFDESNTTTADVATGRRPSSYFLPIASPKKKVKGLFDSLLADEKKTETDHVNRVRASVKLSAVNNERTHARWAFIEINNPNTSKQVIRKFLKERTA